MKPSRLLPRPALNYRGGKFTLAPWIIEHMPDRAAIECYAEPFAGGLSVLLHLAPFDFEAVNDADDEIVDFWKAIRDHYPELKRRLDLTPNARTELARCLDERDGDVVERARRVFARCWLGVGSANRRSGWRFQPAWVGWAKSAPKLFRDMDHLGYVAWRMSQVQIDCCDAKDFIHRWKRKGTFFLVDPPYVPEHRQNSRRLYKLEPTVEYHRELAAELNDGDHMAMVCGYPSALYDEIFPAPAWTRVSTVAYAEKQKKAVECLWINARAMEARKQKQLELVQ